ncbi:MAG: 4Fe-4S binding protein [Actinobacteria bacterium]|nr:4Fe-4S binding protein [Actinomycetota bacterium]
MSKLSTILGLLEKIESVDIAVHQERCVVVRNRNASCRRCAEACTSGALSFTSDELVVSSELCIGCGTCATVCPTCALEAQRPNDAELFAQSLRAVESSQGKPVIACSSVLDTIRGYYDESHIVEVTCLGRLEESLLCGMVANGADTVYLVEGACDTCPHTTGHTTVSLVCDTANSLMRMCEHEDSIELVCEVPDFALRIPEEGRCCSTGVSRREFFMQLKDGIKTTAVTAVNAKSDEYLGSKTDTVDARYKKVTRDGTLPHFVPNRRERLLDWLSVIGYPACEAIETRLWGHIGIDERLCTSCRMCATFCPTGAIMKFDDEDGVFGVEHYPTDCVHCRLCADICPQGAITISHTVPTAALAEGLYDRFEMAAVKDPPNQPKSIYNRMYALLGGGQVYER